MTEHDAHCLHVAAKVGGLNSPLTASYPFSWTSALRVLRDLISSHAPNTSAAAQSVRAAHTGLHTP